MNNRKNMVIGWCVPEFSFPMAAAQRLLSAHGFVIRPLDLTEPIHAGADLAVFHSDEFHDLVHLLEACDRFARPALIVVNSLQDETKAYQWPNLPLTVDVCRTDALQDQIVDRLRRLRQATVHGRWESSAHGVNQGPSTDIHSRAYLGERLAREVANAYKHCRSLSIALIELDRFDEISRACGNAMGDQLFELFAETVSTNIRIVDWLAQHGERQLCLVMPDTWLEEGRQVVERIREAIATRKIAAIGNQHLRLSLSIGVAELTDNEADHEALIHKAGVALMRAVSEGGNQVCIEVS